MEFPEGRVGGSILGADFGKSREGEGSYEKSLPWGGMDIFWNHTLYPGELDLVFSCH